MRNFKIFFYGLYFLFFLFSGFVALNYENLVLHWDWDPISTWTGLIRFVLKLGGVGLVLFALEIIIENIHLFAKSRKIARLEKEVLDIKAKFYDLTKEEAPIEKEINIVEDLGEEKQQEGEN